MNLNALDSLARLHVSCREHETTVTISNTSSVSVIVYNLFILLIISSNTLDLLHIVTFLTYCFAVPFSVINKVISIGYILYQNNGMELA